MFGLLLRIARAVLMSVLQRLTQQINVVEQAAKTPVERMLAEVAGGSIWRGNGAIAFQQEISNNVLPRLTDIIGHSTRYKSNIERAAATIDEADVKSRNLVNKMRSIIEMI